MKYEVRLTEAAELDLTEIHGYIARHDSPQSAEHVLNGLVEAAEELSTSPDRGSYPKELRALGIREFRQVFFKPYRLIYRVEGRRVIIYLIADGRRDMQTLLSRRLLG